jgi:uncharacterized protein (TIGR02145 family)
MRALFTFAFFCLLLACATTCKKNRDLYPPAAQLFSQRLQTGISSVTLQAGFSGLDITERGICWSTDGMPLITGEHLASGSGDGTITATISDLSANTTYYARAYAINKGGTGYSEPVSFVVQQPPVISTGPAFARSTNSTCIISTIGYFNAMGNGSYGVCYGTHQGPTVDDHTTGRAQYPGNSLTSTLTGLEPGTVYYARSFVLLNGTAYYGNERQFNTYSGTATDIDGNLYYTVKIGAQEWMVDNLRTTRYQDGTAISSVNRNSWSSYVGDARGVNQDNEYNALQIGRYYNREAVTNSHGLAPEGWRIPSYADWQQLFSYVGIDSAAFRLIKVEWSGSGADNRWGLSVMPGGMRNLYGNDEPPPFSSANYWSSTSQAGSQQTVIFGLTYFDYLPYVFSSNVGLSVRCVSN